MNEETNVNAGGSGRYSAPRRCIRWEKDPQLGVLKMLGWRLFVEEHPSKDRLWQRVDELCERVMLLVLGEAGVTLPDIVHRVQQEQGATITPNKLMQRADKAERYFEFNEWMDAVSEAFDQIVAATPSEALDQPSQSPDETGF